MTKVDYRGLGALVRLESRALHNNRHRRDSTVWLSVALDIRVEIDKILAEVRASEGPVQLSALADLADQNRETIAGLIAERDSLKQQLSEAQALSADLKANGKILGDSSISLTEELRRQLSEKDAVIAETATRLEAFIALCNCTQPHIVRPDWRNKLVDALRGALAALPDRKESE